MTLQNADNFLVSRDGTSHKLDWVTFQEDISNSLPINIAFDVTVDDVTLDALSVDSTVPYSAVGGLKLPVAGINDLNVAGAVRYNSVAEKVELYAGGSWVIASGVTLFSSTTPSPASIGDVWYDIDDGRAYVYYNDGTSSQWVEMNPSWNGGIPPEAIDPDKMSPGAITWNADGNHCIGGTVDTDVSLKIETAGTGDTGLQIESDSGFDAKIVLNEGTSAAGLQIGQSSTQNYLTSSAASPLNISTTLSQPINLKTTGVERITITGNGNIGFNSANPTVAFESFSDVVRFDNTNFDGRGVTIRTSDTTFETFISASRNNSNGNTSIAFKYDDATTTDDNASEIAHKINGSEKMKTHSTGVDVTGDVKVVGSAVGVVLEAPDGGLWRITVANDGSLTTTSV
jgi:hypothetical protein